MLILWRAINSFLSPFHRAAVNTQTRTSLRVCTTSLFGSGISIGTSKNSSLTGKENPSTGTTRPSSTRRTWRGTSTPSLMLKKGPVNLAYKGKPLSPDPEATPTSALTYDRIAVNLREGGVWGGRGAGGSCAFCSPVSLSLGHCGRGYGRGGGAEHLPPCRSTKLKLILLINCCYMTGFF